jgi:cell division protein FtsI (penicillin-binding protein 3)
MSPSTGDARSRVAQVARGERAGRPRHPADHLAPRAPSSPVRDPRSRATAAPTSRREARKTVSVSSRPTRASIDAPLPRVSTSRARRPATHRVDDRQRASVRDGFVSAVGVLRAIGEFFTRTTPRPGGRETVPVQVTRTSTRRRQRWTIVMLTALFALILWELVDVQVLNPTAFAAFGESQRVRTETLAADRGTIYDRNGVELAMSTPQKSIFADPLLVEDARAEAALLAPILGLPAADLEQKLAADNRFTYLARQVTPEVAQQVIDLKQSEGRDGEVTDRVPGVHLIDEPKRFTPSDDLAKSIIGQVDIDGNGISGLEAKYTDDLTGTPGQLVLERTPQGRTIAAGDQSLFPAVRGKDLELTIDRSLQFDTERILSDQVADAGAKSGMAIVMKPDTGEILAMVNVASDPETGEVSVDANNAGVTTVYEPGSVMKIVSAAGAIEDGKVEPDTVIPVTDEMQICDQRFSEHDYHGNVGWPVSTILAQSSNIGTIKLADMIGKDELYRYMKAFGFGEKTAVDFPNEQSGTVRAPEDWDCSSRGAFPIGQGVSVTPLQMLQAYNTIANGGLYVPPKLVNATVDADGTRHPNMPAENAERRVISRETANKMNLMLRSVVQEGTGTLAKITGYTPAGKTGTSRKPFPGGGYTWPDGAMHYQATFVGFVPAEAPELSIIVVIDEPTKEGIFGGVVAAPAFAKIGETALRHFAIAPPSSDLAAEGLDGDVPTIDVITSDVVTDTTVNRTADGRVRAPAAGSAPPVDPATAGTAAPLASGETDAPATTTTAPRYNAENNWGAGGPPTTPPVYNAENNWGAG